MRESHGQKFELLYCFAPCLYGWLPKGGDGCHGQQVDGNFGHNPLEGTCGRCNVGPE